MDGTVPQPSSLLSNRQQQVSNRHNNTPTTSTTANAPISNSSSVKPIVTVPTEIDPLSFMASIEEREVQTEKAKELEDCRERILVDQSGLSRKENHVQRVSY